MTAPFTQHLTNLLSSSPRIPTLLKTHPFPLTLLTTLSIPLLYTIYSDYRSWLALGRGGLPHNPLGYLVQFLLSPLKAKRFETGPLGNEKILKKAKPFSEGRWLSEEDLPVREGERPEIGRWYVSVFFSHLIFEFRLWEVWL
jgi:hypothetical protein